MLFRSRYVAHKAFKALPLSNERQSMLRALGRIGTATLKQKVLHRAGPLIQAGTRYLPDLAFVLAEAVDARNLYVHGAPSKGRTPAVSGAHLIFLTEALEFTFACSELVEAGWDFGAWLRRPRTSGHVFSRFAADYAESLAAYRTAVADVEEPPGLR